MMDVVLFTLFSLLEYLAILVLLFSLFRFNLNEFVPESLFSSSLMTFFSYWTRYGSNLEVSAPFLQMGLLIVLLWIVYRFHLFWSLLMGGLVYVSYGIIQALILLSLEWLTGIDILAHEIWRYALQGITVLVALLLSWLLHKFDKGFNFVPQGRVLTTFFSKANISLMVSVLVILIAFAFPFYSLLKGHFSFGVSTGTLTLSILTLATFFFMAGRRWR